MGQDLEDAVDRVLKSCPLSENTSAIEFLIVPDVNETKPDSQPTGAPTASVPTASVPTASVPTASAPTATSSNTLVAQKNLGINRKRKRGQQQNGRAKRTRTATTVSAAGSPALATSVAPIAEALNPAPFTRTGHCTSTSMRGVTPMPG
ncbi:hypothetical protein PG996_010644 [Apiospora saccharicola]|uniref:Uncharacterized protein n=1 Tax=Apiospora saccharicola TaxID=335842 RepID=A0ABR1UP58_9PEZI